MSKPKTERQYQEYWDQRRARHWLFATEETKTPTHQLPGGSRKGMGAGRWINIRAGHPEKDDISARQDEVAGCEAPFPPTLSKLNLGMAHLRAPFIGHSCSPEVVATRLGWKRAEKKQSPQKSSSSHCLFTPYHDSRVRQGCLLDELSV